MVHRKKRKSGNMPKLKSSQNVIQLCGWFFWLLASFVFSVLKWKRITKLNYIAWARNCGISLESGMTTAWIAAAGRFAEYKWKTQTLRNVYNELETVYWLTAAAHNRNILWASLHHLECSLCYDKWFVCVCVFFFVFSSFSPSFEFRWLYLNCINAEAIQLKRQIKRND